MTQPLYTLRQLAYVVRDLDSALKYWTEVLEVGPFFKLEHLALDNQRYRGSPSNADITVALGTQVMYRLNLFIVKTIRRRCTRNSSTREELACTTSA